MTTRAAVMLTFSFSPQRGEKVGVRGALRESERCGPPPHPSPLHSPSKTGVRPYGKRGEGAGCGQYHSFTCSFASNDRLRQPSRKPRVVAS